MSGVLRITERYSGYLLAVTTALVAASFAWIFAQQQQRARQNRTLIAKVQAVAFDSCRADRAEEQSLRRVLGEIRDNHQVPLTAAQIAARVAVYDRLIASVRLRDCEKEFASLPSPPR